MISVAHSPDTDDYFLFWAIAQRQIDLRGFEFSFSQFDTEKLNHLAKEQAYDVIAVSLAAYPQIRDFYKILPYGASVGRKYGPVVVGKRKLDVNELNNARIGVPGLSTTAALILSKIAPTADFIPYRIAPFNEGFAALENDSLDALLLIHEGQISFQSRNLVHILDIGQWWNSETGLPLPLGINVIRKSLGAEAISTLSELIHQSIIFGRDHIEKILPSLVELNIARNSDTKSLNDIRRYLGMYANDDSVVLDDECWRAIDLLVGPVECRT